MYNIHFINHMCGEIVPRKVNEKLIEKTARDVILSRISSYIFQNDYDNFFIVKIIVLVEIWLRVAWSGPVEIIFHFVYSRFFKGNGLMLSLINGEFQDLLIDNILFIKNS